MARTISRMVKTTVHLPDDLKRALEGLAAEVGRSEADLIREAVGKLVRDAASFRELATS